MEPLVERCKVSLINFLLEVTPPLLGCSRQQLQRLLSQQTEKVLKPFLLEAQPGVLVIGREEKSASESRDVAAGEDGEDGEENYALFVDLGFVPRAGARVSSVAFLKRPGFSLSDKERGDGNADEASESPAVEGATKPIGQQLALLRCGFGEDESFLELTQLYMQRGFTPFLKTAVKEDVGPGGGDGTGEGAGDDAASRSSHGVETVRKKLTELTLALQQAQQNVDIPLINLPVDPVIRGAVQTAAEEKRKPVVEDIGDRLQDSAYLMSLQSHVNKWIKDIQKVCRMQRDPTTITMSEEVSFWLGFERALQHLEDQLKTPEAELTLAVLKHTRKVFATMSFEQDSGLRQAMEVVQNTNVLMRDFPLNDLIGAISVEQLTLAVRTVFSHMKKLKNATLYPLSRAFLFVEAMSRDLTSQLLSVLSKQNLLRVAFDEFEHVTAGCSELFRTWDEEVRHFKEMARELAKKRGLSERPPSKLVCEHVILQERLLEVRQFRRQHHRLKEVLSRVFSDGGRGEIAASKDVEAAFQLVESVDALDLSRGGEQAWEAAQKAYDSRIDRVESQVTAKLRDRLGASKTSSEMFRVFSQFNALFFRPRIRGAIQEYQTKLIQQVKDDLKQLQGSYIDGSQKLESSTMAVVRDMPQVAGAVVWARQLERRLDGLLQRTEDVLGKGWEAHVEGQKLKLEIDSFRARLNQQALFDSWLNAVKDQKRLNTSDRVFAIRDWGAGRLELLVNFDPDVLTLFKEVRLLSTLQFRIPYSVKVMADEAKVLYPFVIALQEVLRTFEEGCYQVGEEDATTKPASESLASEDSTRRVAALLVAAHRRDVQAKLAEGMSLRWDSDRLEAYVKRLAEVVYIFEAKTEFALQRQLEAAREIESIKDKSIDEATSDSILGVLRSVQKRIEELQLQNFSNVRRWAKVLSLRVEDILKHRLETLLQEWTEQFEQWPNKGTGLIQNGLVLEIQVRSHVLQVHPAVDAARQLWMGALNRAIASVCLLPRFNAEHSSRTLRFGGDAEAWVEEDSEQEKDEVGELKTRRNGTYRNIAFDIPQTLRERAVSAIDRMMEKVEAYVENWLHFQVLWDVDVSDVLAKLGDDIESWQQLLNEVKQARTPFDSGETRVVFGPTIVDHRQVQAKLNTKYDAWHREILNAFGQKVAANSRALFGSLRAMVASLQELGRVEDPTDSRMTAATFFSLSETQAAAFVGSQGLVADELVAALVADVTKFVQKLNEAGALEPQWRSAVDALRASEVLLGRQRFAFPADWLWTDAVEGQAEVFQQLLRHHVQLLDQCKDQVLILVRQYGAAVDERLKQLYADWMSQRPMSNQLVPSQATAILARFEQRLEKAKEEHKCCALARKVLGLEADAFGGTEQPVSPSSLEEEIADMKGVWLALSGLQSDLAVLRDTLWVAVVPKNVRSNLEALLQRIKDIPARFRQYEAFEELREKLNGYLSLNMLITDMKTDALKDRHWRAILSSLKLRKTVSDLTLASLWDADLGSSEALIRDVLLQAQGESALEEFLRQVRDSWRDRELQMVAFGNKCKLVKGWDELFQVIDDQLAALQSMRVSPFFKIFEEEALAWDEKLSRLRSLLDSWVDVQRKWLYLEGVFTGSQDIQLLLPAEYQRFKGIDTDFKNIMKKADTTKIVMDMAATDGLGRQLERLSDSLARIQKALGEYLEKQREQFSRFYFVGDEDLLEMIGNAKDVKVVQKHVNKLFAGIAALETDPEDPTTIVAMRSREGEVVPFVTSVPILQYVSLKDWLSAVEVQMVVTLADCVSRALRALEELDLANVAKQQLAEADAAGEGATTRALAAQSPFLDWVRQFPVQALLLALNVHWTKQCEAALAGAESAATPDSRHPLEGGVLEVCVDLLGFLADRVVLDVGPLVRHRMVHVITELVHQRDVCRALIAKQVRSVKSFHWLQCMRHYFTHPTPSSPVDPSTLLKGFSKQFSWLLFYLSAWERRGDSGLAERLVLTPLTDKCFLTLTQALSMKLGGNPFGPAGTGKTESVKALGAALGRYTLVFNCDETFDFHAMGRIFSGLCQVGAWGCFDEFNRLDERILSAVSEQILTIQIGLREGKKQVELLGKATTLNGNVGIFVTMNPGYAGRSNLPDNLKQLFREVAMINPDKQLIAQVTLFAQGFRSAERLASKIISLYDLCDRQLSKQPHYDFGLRSLKSALNSAGSLKRHMLQNEASNVGGGLGSTAADVELVEQQLLLRSVTDTVVPKLVAQDVPLLKSLLLGVFPDADVAALEERALREEICRLCQVRQLQPAGEWMEKVLQLFQIQKLQHGVMLVGSVGTGKSCAWRVLLEAMEKVDGVKGVSYVLDPKVVPKEQLYGKLDSTTLEWQDGVFTAVLRKILSASQELGSGSCSQRRHWIVFDGDVDPDWAENLNSALDDNKLLTLPNGERLEIPSNVRIIFEVETLKFATLATVSRCGIVWFSETVLPDSRLFENQLAHILCGGGEALSMQTLLGASSPLERRLSSRQLSRDVASLASGNLSSVKTKRFGLATGRGAAEAEAQLVRETCVQALEPYFVENGFASQCLQCAERYPHIMTFTKIRTIESTFSLIRKGINRSIERAAELRGEGISVDLDVIALFITKWMVLSILWGMGGSLSLASRSEFSSEVARLAPVPLPSSLAEGSQAGEDPASSDQSLLDFEPFVEDGQWHHWSERVKQVEIDTSQVKDASLVIQTVDTVRHRDVVAGWLDERKPFILCGPPGSGKTMTLTAVLKERTDFDIAFLNFSSGTSPDLLLKTFDHYCEFSKTAAGGMVMRPAVPGKSLIVFCDECNLPLPDKYGTQTAIMLIRQIAESGGFWRLMPQQQQTSPWVWVRVEGVQFAGACNPPTDAGRHPMSNRFLRHAPVIFVDFPGKESLKQIYRTFNRALLRPYPAVSGYAEALTQAMVEFYVTFSRTFTIEQQPHYIYSPRELTRWKLALAEAFDVGAVDFSNSLGRRRSLAWTEEHVDGRTSEEASESISLEQLVRTYVHEGLRIFKDRLVTEDECQRTDAMIDEITKRFFVDVDESALQRPILFTYLGSRRYSEVTRQSLRSLLQGKLRVFNEEVFNVQLVFFDEVLDHVTRIDRVLRQPLGHLLLVGASGAGKTILTKFVAWMNGLSIFQIKAGRNYSTESFEHDLRNVMKRAAIKEEKIAFIIDESNSLGPAFLERMNALLASGEVPGLFEGDEYTSLINECKVAYGSDYLGSNEATELFGRFTKQVQRNLHIIFTMNPANPDFYNRQATSPALFNRCVIDWFGEWSRPAMTQVAYEFTNAVHLPPESFADDAVYDTVVDGSFSQDEELVEVDTGDNARRVHLAKAIVAFYFSVVRSNKALVKVGRKSNFMTPRDFLDFLHHFRNLVEEKSDATSEQQHHLQAGLQTLARVEQQVGQMRAELTEKEGVLKEKNQQAECKMQQMVDQQAEAEEKKRGAEILARRLDEQTGVIAERKDAVQEQLSAVEPLLKEAAEAVTNIPKKSLDELKSMANPPAMAKAAVEAVAVLITDAGEKPVSWEDARKILKAQDFITKVLNFDCALVSAATRKRIQSKFLTGDWEIERINKASKAAGPLAQWVESSVKFVAISEQVQPLQTEIMTLEKEAQDNEASLQEQQTLIAQLESKLHQYKEDYAQLISQVQSIKREMEEVQKKCGRSMALLENLGSEKTRWFEQLEVLQLATQTFVGDSLLAAAFCAYLGFFEYADRHRLIDEWRAVLTSECIRFRADLSFVEFLSTPSERLQWAAHSLPHDDLSIENAIILKRFLRFPLIIDPSGQAINFLMSFLASKKLSRTSFVDVNFLKNLESSLRFGSTLLIHDVEKVDPILNPVLNKETHKIGGRVMITVGDSEIDLSPSFSLYMATRDPNAQFTPDLCSRVTMVNFTLTPSSLVNQCLNMILKSERPDIDKRRSDMLKLQGEFKVKIRELEDALLHALSNVKGNILDDDSVMSTMETLKQQAAEVAKEAARTEQVMAEVEQTSNMYLPWALAAGRIYFTLLNLSCVSFLYQYDSQFFIGGRSGFQVWQLYVYSGILQETLSSYAVSQNDTKITDYTERLNILLAQLFTVAYRRVAYSLSYSDRLVFGLQLAFIRVELDLKVPLESSELQLLFQGMVDGGDGRTSEVWTEDLGGHLSPEQLRALQKLLSIEPFSKLQGELSRDVERWVSLLNASSPEDHLPDNIFEWSVHPLGMHTVGVEGIALNTWLQLIRKVLLLKALRPDRVNGVLIEVCESVLGKEFLTLPELTQELIREFVEKKASSTVPVLFVTSPGFDSSGKINQLAVSAHQTLSSVAMGSKEGFTLADKAISAASRQGTWVLLKNVHLSPKWLEELEKKLYRMQAHVNFRLFLTMEYNPKVPTSLIRMCCKFVFEPPAGIKASLVRSYATLFGLTKGRCQGGSVATPSPVSGIGSTESIRTKAPAVARCRLQFLLAFLHAVILERKRYAPVGWCKLYEFSDADQRCALKVLDSWIDSVAQRGDVLSDHVAPERLPWNAIRTLISQVCYGGRLDNDVDNRILQSFVDHLFRPEAFESSFCLNMPVFNNIVVPHSTSTLKAPELLRNNMEYLSWIDSLPSRETPEWFGFSSRAEWLLASREGTSIINNWSTLLLRGQEEALDFLGIAQSANSKAAQRVVKQEASVSTGESEEVLTTTSWLTLLIPVVNTLLLSLPDGVKALERTDELVQNPLFRCFERELGIGIRLYRCVKTSLKELLLVCKGEEKMTNSVRDLATLISSSRVPSEWSQHYVSSGELTVAEWLDDFKRRLLQLSLISEEFGNGGSSNSMRQACMEQLSRQRDDGALTCRRIWLGGLFFPSVYLTATRQAVAQANGWSLDDLFAEVALGIDTAPDEQSFIITGLTVEGATWNADGKCLDLTESITGNLPPMVMRWYHRTQGPSFNSPGKKLISVPLFLNRSRRDIISFIGLPFPSVYPESAWVQRATAVFLWTNF